jgi:hypothetical protein
VEFRTNFAPLGHVGPSLNPLDFRSSRRRPGPLMKKFPYCVEEIRDETIVCRFCGRSFAPSEQTAEWLEADADQRVMTVPAPMSILCRMPPVPIVL